MIDSERHVFGWIGLVFPGVPVWTVRFLLPFCRAQFLKPVVASIREKLASQSDILMTQIFENSLSVFMIM